MGFDVTVITDNMPAFVMEREHVDLFTCAADAICLDGYVVNKVGTLQIAICANHFGIPTFVTGAPDIGHETKDTVKSRCATRNLPCRPWVCARRRRA